MYFVSNDDEYEDMPKFAVPYGICVGCGVGTRSHCLTPPEWERIEQEVVVNESDDYATDQWEETETVVKWVRTVEPEVMCHKCWISTLDKMQKKLHQSKEAWETDIESNKLEIQKYLKEYKLYGYKEHNEVGVAYKKEVDKVEKMFRGYLIGE